MNSEGNRVAMLRLRPGETDGRNLASMLWFELRTQREVAEILQTTQQNVQQTERRAIQKLRRHPALREIARSWGIRVAQ